MQYLCTFMINRISFKRKCSLTFVIWNVIYFSGIHETYDIITTIVDINIKYGNENINEG